MTRYKLLHGVLLGAMVVWQQPSYPRSDAVPSPWVAGVSPRYVDVERKATSSDVEVENVEQRLLGQCIRKAIAGFEPKKEILPNAEMIFAL